MPESSVKTLVVEYAPRGKQSLTKKMRTYFTDLIAPKAQLEILDLCANQPPLMNAEMLNAYYKRSYLGQDLSPAEAKSLSQIDKLRDQLLRSEVLILSAPMYNFGYPAAVKAWIDAVMQKEHVYTHHQNVHKPLLQHLKVCIIYTAGITYDQINENENWNGLLAEGARLFEFMGAKTRVVHLEGVDMLLPKNIKYRMKNVVEPKFKHLAQTWYGVDASQAGEIIY